MRVALTALLLCGALSLGCAKKTDSAAAPAAGGSTANEAAEPAAGSASADGEEAAEGALKFGPENAKIGFVGKHAGADPKPRTGGFEKFAGEAEVDADSKALKSIKVDIEADSLWTEFAKLTAHLNSADFLDTREYPTATFESTKIEAGEKPGEITVTGKLTLHGVTKEITFPATFELSEDKPALKAAFPLKRSDFGMDKMLEGVVDDVDLEIVLGEKTEKLPEQAGPG